MAERFFSTSALLLTVLLSPAGSALGATELFPDRDHHPSLLADTREVQTLLQYRSGSPRIDANLGETIGLLKLISDSWSLRMDIEAGIFMGFIPGGELTFGMLTVDGLFRLPLRWERGPWMLQADWSHDSAHYADGVRTSPHLPRDRGTWSRESLRQLLFWRSASWQLYLGPRELIHSIPEAPFLSFQAGWTFVPARTTGLFHALDLKTAAENAWSPSLSFQAGVLRGTRASRDLRLGAELFHGWEDTGQLSGRKDQYIGAFFAISSR